jgi:hypothetical protein
MATSGPKAFNISPQLPPDPDDQFERRQRCCRWIFNAKEQFSALCVGQRDNGCHQFSRSGSGFLSLLKALRLE